MTWFRKRLHVVLLGSLGIAAIGARPAGAQCVGEAATDARCSPRLVNMSPGVQEIVMDVSTATADLVPNCGFNVGHTVWFKIVPTASGRLTFSTCHPATGYDTVLQYWQDIGDCEFPVLDVDHCVDDTDVPECENGCSFKGGRVTIQVTAMSSYLFQVGSYDSNIEGCDLCLGVRITLCADDETPPTADISSPTALSCVCNGAQIVGTVADPDGVLAGYTLDYRAASGGAWTTINSGSSPIVDGVLGTWSTAALSQGYYLLRLNATNTCGGVSSAVQVVWLDIGFDDLLLHSPGVGAIHAGIVCFDGSAWDHCFTEYTVGYRPAGSGSFQPVDPLFVSYGQSVINDPLATWDTVGLGIPDGEYEVQLFGAAECSAAASVQDITVDNTMPTAVIDEPASCLVLPLGDPVSVLGTANDANLAFWVLEYTGGGASFWIEINSGVGPMIGGLLGTWDTTGLPPCAYLLRLRVWDQAIVNCNAAIDIPSEVLVPVTLRCMGDTDDSGEVDIDDVVNVVLNWGVCP